VKILALSTCIIIFLAYVGCTKQNDLPELKGPYLGQTPPGMTPEIFAPGIISTVFHEHSFPAFSPDGKEILWTRGFRSSYRFRFPVFTLSVKITSRGWSQPEYAQFAYLTGSAEASFSPDGNRVYFSASHSIDPGDAARNDLNIWTVEREGTQWSVPEPLDSTINTAHTEMQPTVTRQYTLYYVGHFEGGKNNYGIYRSELHQGHYTKPELLPSSINSGVVDWTPFIDPDERYILFSSSRPGGYGRGDLYISYRYPDGSWTEAINFGPTINEDSNERYPYVSPDGKFLFFVSDKVNDNLLTERTPSYKEMEKFYLNPGNGFSDVYWLDAKIIEELKPNK